MSEKFQNFNELADKLGMPVSSLTVFFYSSKKYDRIRKPEIRRKIFEITGIESYKFDESSGSEGDIFRNWIRSNVNIKMGKKRGKDLDKKGMIGRDNVELRFKTQLELARALGMPKGTLSSFISTPGKKILKLEYRRNIFKITEISSYASDEPSGSERQEFLDWISRNVQTHKTRGNRQTGSLPPDDFSRQHEGLQVLPKSTTSTGSEISSLIETIETASARLRRLIGTGIPGATEGLQRIVKEESGSVVNKFLATFSALKDFLELLKKSTPEQRKMIKDRIPPRDIGYVTSFLRALYDEDHFSDFMFFSEYKVGENYE